MRLLNCLKMGSWAAGCLFLVLGLALSHAQNAHAAVTPALNDCGLGTCTASGTPASGTDPTGCTASGTCSGPTECVCKSGVTSRSGSPTCQGACPEPFFVPGDE